MRAGGAGIAAFFTRTGVETLIAKDKETRVFNSETYLMETGLTADLAIVKAWKGDPYGNLVYRKSARNFNPMAATCGRVTVAEVEAASRSRRARARPDTHAWHLRAAAHRLDPQ
jgi:3-oxoacid CoA-transferase subunit A